MTDELIAPAAAARPAKSDIDMRLFVALMAHTIVVNLVVALVRVTTSYRAIELDLSVVWIGIIAAGFSLVPIFGAVWVGRFIDRGHDSRSAWIGAAFMLVACLGLWLRPDSAIDLLVSSIVLGFGHMFCMASHQMLAVRSSGPISREGVFGYHMIAISLGQGLGPMTLGWLGGTSAIPPTGLLFTLALIGAAVSQVLAFTLRPAPKPPAHGSARPKLSVRDLLRIRGLPAALTASVVTVTAFELLVVYLPLLGTERAITTRDIGLLLAARSVVSIVSRLFYSRLLVAVGRLRLLVTSMLASAAAFTLMGLPVPLSLMYVAIVAMGFGLGISSTLSFSEIVLIAPVEARATALSLRLTGNRFGQMMVPLLASVIATATGIGGVLIIIAATLAGSAIAVGRSLSGTRGDDPEAKP